MDAPTPEEQRAHLRLARTLAGAAFRGRRGHGGGPCLRRSLNRSELEAWLAFAVSLGARYERGRAARAVLRRVK